MRGRTKVLFVLIAAASLAGCAGDPARVATRSAADPWEPLNRPIYAVNDAFDKVLIKPIAKGYEFVFPEPIRRGVTNFSRNLRTPLVGINNLLQGKTGDASNDLGRFLLNSTFGVAGIFDLATPAGFDRNDEDFGQTLAVWGVPSGPYVVVPFLGPNTLRDALMIPFNIAADPLIYLDNSSVRDKLYFLRLIDVRQRLFAAEDLIKDSPDKYVTIRESFLQRRDYLIYDGSPPVDEDPYDDLLEDYEEY
jgi:phospholipid-binding lipoprotein MlaA